MNYQLEMKDRDAVVLKLMDRITVYQLEKFRQIFKVVQRKMGERKRLLIDMESLLYMDPLALGVIVAFSKEFRSQGGDIRIVRMNGELKHIFEESRLSKVYQVYDSVSQATKGSLI